MFTDRSDEKFTYPATSRVRGLVGIAAGLVAAAFLGAPMAGYWAGQGEGSVEGVLWVEPGASLLHVVALTRPGFDLRRSLPEVPKELWDNVYVEVGEDRSLVHLEVIGLPRDEAARGLDALMTGYAQFALERKSEELRGDVEVLEAQTRAAEAMLIEAERSLEEARTSLGDGSRRSDADTAEEVRLRRQVASAEGLYAATKARLEAARLESAARIPPVKVVSRPTGVR